jgi:hypothetical protein
MYAHDKLAKKSTGWLSGSRHIQGIVIFQERSHTCSISSARGKHNNEVDGDLPRRHHPWIDKHGFVKETCAGNAF